MRPYSDALFEPADIIEVRCLYPGGQRQPRSFWIEAGKIAELRGLKALNAAGYGIYVSANPRARLGGSKAADVALARCIFADFDGISVAEALARIAAAKLPPPTAIVSSGHGVHAYWRLNEPITDLAAWTEIQRNLAALLDSDPSVADPPRVMRLPNYANTKRQPHVPCAIIECDPDRRYEWAELLPLIPKRVEAQHTGGNGQATPVNGEILDGQRNRTLASLAGSMRRRGMSADAIYAALAAENAAKCRPMLDDGEVRSIAESVSRYEPAKDASMIVPPPRRPDPWCPFPVEALPSVMARFASAIAESLCIDPAMVGLPMLTIAGACVGNTARARMSGDYLAPPNVWSAVVTRSGERKSPVLRAVMAPIHAIQAKATAEHAEKVDAYDDEMERWKAKPKKERGDRPVEPGPYPHLYLSDTTTEAIAVRLAVQPRGLTLVLDELAGFFSGMNQYRTKGGNDREAYLAFYDAGAAKIDRKSAMPPTIFIPSAFVAITGMIQPAALAGALGPLEFASGLAARFLLAAPPPQRATWKGEGVADDVRDGWRSLLVALLDTPLPQQPTLIPPSDAAMRLWAQAHDRLEVERHQERDDRMRAARAKLIGVIPRLSLIFQCVSAASGEKNATVRCIDQTSMERAIELVEWFTRETRRVYGVLTDDGSEDDIISRIEANGGMITPRQLAHCCRALRGRGMAEDYLDSLARDGFGRWGWSDQSGRGRPSLVFILHHRGNGNENADGDSASPNSVTVTAPAEDENDGPPPDLEWEEAMAAEAAERQAH